VDTIPYLFLAFIAVTDAPPRVVEHYPVTESECFGLSEAYHSWESQVRRASKPLWEVFVHVTCNPVIGLKLVAPEILERK
jgi:hypothetical protein